MIQNGLPLIYLLRKCRRKEPLWFHLGALEPVNMKTMIMIMWSAFLGSTSSDFKVWVSSAFVEDANLLRPSFFLEWFYRYDIFEVYIDQFIFISFSFYQYLYTRYSFQPIKKYFQGQKKRKNN